MPYKSKKGDRGERELVNALDSDNFAIMRAPASGAGTERKMPDVLAGNGNVFYAIEAKWWGTDTGYIDGEEVEGLEYFAEKFGAIPLLGIKFDVKPGDPAHGDDDHPGFYFFHPEDVYVTDGGNYRVKKETALEDGISYPELVEQAFESHVALA